ncbi:MAG: DUF2807 domain-containing protein [Calditrichaeota bacterium]|nr:DUF2807 domain-containing protein [Calditrichota bacterium]
MKLLLTLILISALSAQAIKKDLSDFERIKINVPANTIIEFGNRNYIEIDGKEKLVKDVEVNVYGKTLEIDMRDKNFFNDFFGWRKSQDMKIKIIAKKLNKIELNASGYCQVDDLNSENFEVEINGSTDLRTGGKVNYMSVAIKGSGNVRFDELIGKEMEISIRGSGDISAAGSYDLVDIEIKGSGDVEAYGLKSKVVNASIYGSGDINITATEELDAKIYGSGDITYKGEPRRVRDKVYGSGDIARF